MKEIKKLININNELVDEIFHSEFRESRKFNSTDKVLFGLFKGIIEKSDSLLLLLENNKHSGNDVLLRAIFESSVYLRFILEKHTNDRAKSYYLSNKLKEIKMIEQAMNDAPKGRAIREYTNINKNQLTEIYNSMDNLEKINNIKNDYKEMTTVLSPNKWYKIQKNIHSFESMCEYFGPELLTQYEIIYRMLSQETHGKDAESYFDVDKAEGKLTIKTLELDVKVISFVKSFLLESGKAMSRRYSKRKFYKRKISTLKIKNNFNA